MILELIFATTNSISFERESDRQMFLWFWVMPSIGDLMWSHPSNEPASSLQPRSTKGNGRRRKNPQPTVHHEKSHVIANYWHGVSGSHFGVFFVLLSRSESYGNSYVYVSIWTAEVYHLNVIRRKDTYVIGQQLKSQRRRFEVIYFSSKKSSFCYPNNE